MEKTKHSNIILKAYFTQVDCQQSFSHLLRFRIVYLTLQGGQILKFDTPFDKL